MEWERTSIQHFRQEVLAKKSWMDLLDLMNMENFAFRTELIVKIIPLCFV